VPATGGTVDAWAVRMSTSLSSPGAPGQPGADHADLWIRPALRIPRPTTIPVFMSVLEADHWPGNISVTKQPLNTPIRALRSPRTALERAGKGFFSTAGMNGLWGVLKGRQCVNQIIAGAMDSALQ